MDIPVNIQVYRCYGIVRELLEARGYDVDAYPLLTIEQIQQTQGGDTVASPVPPIVVPASLTRIARHCSSPRPP